MGTWELRGRDDSPETLLARDRLSQRWSCREVETGFSPRRRRACGHKGVQDTVRGVLISLS